MNELTPNNLDQTLYAEQPEQRKPLREFIDNKLLPNLGAIAAPPMAAVSSLAHLQRIPRVINVA
jgi:hypothetical protein